MRKTIGGTRGGIQRTFTTCLKDLDFADDIVLISSTREHMQDKTTNLNETPKTTRLTINKEKTKLLRIINKNKELLVLNGEPTEDVDEFRYLQSVISKDGGTKKDIVTRKKKTQVAFIQLRPIWKSKKISTKTKIKIYRSNIRAVLLYGAESWRMTEADLSVLRGFDNKCLQIFWSNVISNKDLKRTTCIEQIDKEIMKRTWTWIGHLRGYFVWMQMPT